MLQRELRTQRREPLTVLYMLVLGILAGAFAAAGPVELVRNRGVVPRDAAWSMLLASTALTAFGQVITTMVAATVVLRDEAERVNELLTATLLSRREYLLGKLLAALCVLVLIYAAIPLGLAVGAVAAGGAPLRAFTGSVLPFVWLVLPTMLAVGALQFAVGVISGRLWVIVAQGLLLIWLWSACVDGAISPAIGAASAWLDPFGSAAVLRSTADWSDLQRATGAMPITAAIIGGRALWLLIGSVAAFLALTVAPRADANAHSHAASRAGNALSVHAQPLLRGGELSAWRGLRATTSYVASWILRDPGWRILALLGAINVGVHALIEARVSSMTPDVTTVALTALHLHARLFLILLATIYAGEVVWREREERSSPLFDALPISDGSLLLGRVSGVIVAQCALVFALTLTASGCAMIGGRAIVSPGVLILNVFFTVLLPFLLWMLIALGVHVAIQQKVAGHLLCIAAWVLAVISSRNVAAPVNGDQPAWWWAVAAGGALLVAWLGWVRGNDSARGPRIRGAIAGAAFS